MKHRIKQIQRILLLFLVCLITSSSTLVQLTDSPFYVQASNFDDCLHESALRYQEYVKKYGPAFLITDEVEATKPMQINEPLFVDKKIHLRVYHTGGYDYIFRKQIMIPSMGSRWGDPILEGRNGRYNVASQDPILFCDHTQNVERWEPKVLRKKAGPVQIGAGKKSERVLSGVGSSYFWKSEHSYNIKGDFSKFSALVAPMEGSSIFMAMNEDMHSFLESLHRDFPKEYKDWLGLDGKNMNRLAWLGMVNVMEIHSGFVKNNKEVKAKLWLQEFNYEAVNLSYSEYDFSLQESLKKEISLLEDLQKKVIEKDRLGRLSDDEILSWANQAKLAQKKILLSNPLLNFDEILAIKRHKIPGKTRSIGQGPDPFGQASNYQSLSMVNRDLWDNALVKFGIGFNQTEQEIYKPKGNRFLGKIDLHFNAEKVLLSQPNKEMTYQVFELELESGKIRQVTPDVGTDVDNYDACYLPSEEIVFASTACYHGVPCVNGNSNVANLCKIQPDGSEMRMLCFDQDDNWHPTVLNNGKVMYTRWEYTDSPHFFTRILMSMNPDGTNQRAYYGSNSYWPNAIFFAQAIPNDPGKIVGVVSGHHGTRRAGELILFDPAKGRHEADGVVQRIGGTEKEVEPIVTDRLVDETWPRFLNPYPLSDKYFIVSAQLSPYENWAIYLLDVHDNITLLRADPDYHLLEPIPLKARPTPPVIPDRINLESDDASVYIQNVYFGPGLKDIPIGEVKSLRLFEWHYAYRGTGGHTHVGIDGPWEPRRILGTVPVYADGSAHFTVPANTPIAIQPLDSEGRALQIMRSWFTAMPGERISCVGCHEDANQVPIAKPTMAARAAAVNISGWKGPERSYSFKHEVQPVLDRLCIECHNGENVDIPNFRLVDDVSPLRNNGFKFTSSYAALHPFVRRPGPENDYHLSNPMEYHADQTELIQLLKKGHYSVKMDSDAWERLYCWIDLNVPDHGTWMDHTTKIEPFIERRRELREMYAGVSHNPEESVAGSENHIDIDAAPPQTELVAPVIPSLSNWPVESKDARKMQKSLANKGEIMLKLGNGVEMKLVNIPSGEFLRGSNNGPLDEFPVHKVDIEDEFYMAECETSLEQFWQFDPEHKQGVVNWTNKDQGAIGYPLDNPDFPVIRISWQEAQSFCNWLSEKTGYVVSLPTEAEWEWACRAGTSSDLNYGELSDDFSSFANLADTQLSRWARRESPQWQPRIDQFDDHHMIFSETGSYEANIWGLYDMHGNASEFTSSPFEAYPGNENLSYADEDKVVVKGGSWYDRPYRARSGYRLDYEKYQKSHNVGFRVIVRKN